MTNAISPKLLIVLAMAIAVGCFGAWNLFSAGEAVGDVGFGEADRLPVVVSANPDELAPIQEPAATQPRNPFERITPETGLPSAPIEVPSDSDEPTPTPTPTPTAETSTPATEPALPEPVFPDPGLVDRGPGGRNDPRNDTSFEG